MTMLTTGGCPRNILTIKDALEAIEGRWRLLILFALSGGSRRFGELSREVPGITDKMLSKELKNLEAHLLITREVTAGFPQAATYTITDHGRSLERVMIELHYWGLLHRQEVMGR